MAEPDSEAPAPRVRRGELLSAGSAVLLVLVMFLLKWYGVAQGAGRSALRSGLSSAENAWHGLTILRWLMLLSAIVAVGSLVIRASQSSHGTQTDGSRLVTALGALTAVLLGYRVLIALPDPDKVVDQKLGAILGLLCAIGIAFGGWESMREQRGRAGTVKHRSRTDAPGAPRGVGER